MAMLAGRVCCKGVDSARLSCAAEQEQRQRHSWGRTSGLFEARQGARPRPPLKKKAFDEKCLTTPTPAQFKQFPSQILKSHTLFLLTSHTDPNQSISTHTASARRARDALPAVRAV